MSNIRNHLELRLAMTESELAKYAADLSGNMQHLVETLETGGAVNSLGEVQGHGLTIDRLCAIRNVCLDALRVLDQQEEQERD